ncbi:MAG: hypothetical protein IJA93_02965 [Clostridia bacterium]|nr:hypothetical protein [Clostridiales bacterium]MBQ3231907.1 hypothetical protein [Clostridia bacterium]
MKKILSLVLVFVMAMALSTCALGEIKTTPYQHPVLGFTIQAPVGWLQMDSQNIAKLMADPSVAKSFPNVDISAYVDQCIANEMTMFMDIKGSNFNIVGENVGSAFTADQLNLLLTPSLISQYQQIFPSVNFIVDGDTCKMGDNEYAYIVYEASTGVNTVIGAQYMICESGMLYYITLTIDNAMKVADYIEIDTMFDKVLASFAE